jgi:hypothetical protein
MSGHKNHCKKTGYSNETVYCPFSMYQHKCPYYDGYRQRVEEYPVRQQEPPKNPPPDYTPKIADIAQPNLTSIEFGAISPCIFRMTYLWLKNGLSFWSYLVFINKTIVSGWRYENRQWLSFSADLKEIKNYICS